MKYLLEFDEFYFLEKTGVEPSFFDKDYFQYEYQFEDSNNWGLIFSLNFSLLDKTFSFVLSDEDIEIIKIQEKNLNRIYIEEVYIVFDFNENKKKIMFDFVNRKMISNVDFFHE